VLNEDPPRIAVVSPFLDKQHGTERAASEQVERLARDFGATLVSVVLENF